jgi:amino acid transporter
MKQRTRKKQFSPRVPIAACVICILVVLAFATLLRTYGFLPQEGWWIVVIGGFMVFGGTALGLYLEDRFRRKNGDS